MFQIEGVQSVYSPSSHRWSSEININKGNGIKTENNSVNVGTSDTGQYHYDIGKETTGLRVKQ